jgi:hypothetical protein
MLSSGGRIDLSIAGVESAIGWVFTKSPCTTALQMQAKYGITLAFGAFDHVVEHNELFEQMGVCILNMALFKK